MADRIKAEYEELTQYTVVLAGVDDAALPEARKVIAKGALNVKTDAKRRIGGLAHAPAYPASITYETGETPTQAWAEIGPDKNKRQGALGNILEYGGPHSAPHPHMGPAGEAEQARMEKAAADLVARLLGER